MLHRAVRSKEEHTSGLRVPSLGSPLSVFTPRNPNRTPTKMHEHHGVTLEKVGEFRQLGLKGHHYAVPSPSNLLLQPHQHTSMSTRSTEDLTFRPESGGSRTRFEKLSWSTLRVR